MIMIQLLTGVNVCSTAKESKAPSLPLAKALLKLAAHLFDVDHQFWQIANVIEEVYSVFNFLGLTSTS